MGGIVVSEYNYRIV